jgi:hypothetical protein
MEASPRLDFGVSPNCASSPVTISLLKTAVQ